MATEVVMPQMGESIAEGTITKWLKNVGEHVERDEPLFEISTDKVDAEIPSPAAGTLTEIKFKEGETVEVNTVVAVLDGAGDEPQPKPEAASAKEETTERAEPETKVAAAEPAVASGWWKRWLPRWLRRGSPSATGLIGSVTQVDRKHAPTSVPPEMFTIGARPPPTHSAWNQYDAGTLEIVGAPIGLMRIKPRQPVREAARA